MEYSTIDESKIELKTTTIKGGERTDIYYQGEPLVLKTSWFPCYYSQEFKKVSCGIDEKMNSILKRIEDLIREVKPSDKKEITLTKERKGNYYMNVKLNYAKVFNEKREEINKDVFNENDKQAKLIIKFSKLFSKIGYFGTSVCIVQCMMKKRERVDLFNQYLFDEE